VAVNGAAVAKPYTTLHNEGIVHPLKKSMPVPKSGALPDQVETLRYDSKPNTPTQLNAQYPERNSLRPPTLR
jgi:hypothetical protein|tara:strand:- start:3396 stop:3611 length:216 start_codon:yes stop_codon:yes gene_type:complete